MTVNDSIPTPPPTPRDPWEFVAGVLIVLAIVVFAPMACGATCGLFTRGYNVGAGR